MSVNNAVSELGSLSGWMPLRKAAWRLGMSPGALRKALERRAVKAADGTIEAEWDGLRARKLGNRWLVQLGTHWAR